MAVMVARTDRHLDPESGKERTCMKTRSRRDRGAHGENRPCTLTRCLDGTLRIGGVNGVHV